MTVSAAGSNDTEELGSVQRRHLQQVWTFPTTQLLLLGSFTVNSGPRKSPSNPNPITYSCIEACRSIFGESAIAGSVRDDIATGTCIGDTNANACDIDPKAHDTKVGLIYNFAGAYSAYINDHNCAARNYCY
eukprot:8672626-Pyramimonas_sp.AAC.1